MKAYGEVVVELHPFSTWSWRIEY